MSDNCKVLIVFAWAMEIAGVTATRRGLTKRDASIDKLTNQLSPEAEIHKQNLGQIREACLRIRERCLVPRSTDEDGRHASELTRLNAELARQHQEKSQLQAELDKLVKDDAAIVAALDRKIGLATAAVNELRHVRQTAADSNQMPSVCCPWCDCCIASKTERYPDLVNELVRLPVDVIVAGPAPAAVAAKKATS